MTDPAALYTLTAWLSPGYPVGAYAYSHGLETAVHRGAVHDAASLADWVADCLEHGAGRTDGVLLARAWAGDDVGELAGALAPSAERHRETTEMGTAFATVTAAAWGGADPAPYPVAVGRAARAHAIPVETAILMYLQCFAANLVSAGVRLVPLGQTEGARIVAGLAPLCQRLAVAAVGGEVGGCAFLADIASMQHEGPGPRLFRT